MANPTITIVGRVGQDPVKLSNGGVRLRIVSNDSFKNDTTGKWEDKNTSWWTVKAWKSLAEQTLSVLKKGQEVIVIGKIYEENWTDKDGNTRNSYDINADSIAVTTWSLSKDVSKTNATIKEWHMDDVEVPF
jgi:single-strand DNA-binding protein